MFNRINNVDVLTLYGGGLSLSTIKSFSMRMGHLGNDGRIKEDGTFKSSFVIDNPIFSFEGLKRKTDKAIYLGLTLSNNESNPESKTTIDLAEKAKKFDYDVISIISDISEDSPNDGILEYSDISIKLPDKQYPLIMPGYNIRFGDLYAMLYLDSAVPAILVSRDMTEQDMINHHR